MKRSVINGHMGLKDRYNSIKMELIKIGATYSITINPRYQPDSSDLKHLLKWYREATDFFNKYHKLVDLVLYPEASPTGRWHFHGTIVIYDMFAYLNLLEAFQKEYSQRGFDIENYFPCSFEIDTINDLGIWLEYCKKQKNIWYEHFNWYPINNRDNILYNHGGV